MRPSRGIGLATIFALGVALAGPGEISTAEAKPFDWFKSKISKSDDDKATNPDGLVEVEKVGGVVIPQTKPSPQVVQAPDKPGVTTLAEAQYIGTTRIPSMKPPPPPPSMYELSYEYERFTQDLEQLSATTLSTPKSVRAAYARLAAPQPALLSRGWVANAARIVSENPTFQRTLNANIEKHGREKFLKKLSKKNFAKKTFKDSAIERTIVQTVAADVGNMRTLGVSFRETAIRMGRSRWGANEAPVVTFASTGSAAKPYQLSKARAMDSMEPVSDRILNLAARMSMGAAEGSQRSASDKLVSNSHMNQCLSWAKLNLNQCKAAAAKPSEIAYCTSEHALKERADCWSWLVSFDDTI